MIGVSGIDSLPEFYFGMDPPPVASDSEKENEEEKRRRRKSVLEKTAAFEIEARRTNRREPVRDTFKKLLSSLSHSRLSCPDPATT